MHARMVDVNLSSKKKQNVDCGTLKLETIILFKQLVELIYSMSP